MKREITGKLLLCIALIIMIVSLDLFAIHWIVNRKINPVEVPVAVVDLYGGHIIQENEIEMITVPGAYVSEHTCSKLQQVTGKTVSSDAMIPAGSLFYEGQLEK